MNRNLARGILLAAGLIWGFGFIVNKYILDNGWSDSQLLFVRFFTATISIFLVYHKRILKTNMATIKNGMFLGIFLYLGFFFQTWGLANSTPSNNALITASYIMLMPIIIYVMERTHIELKTIIAGLITLAGIGLVTFDFSELTLSYGDTLTFIGSFFYGVHIYLLGKRAKQFDLYVLMSFQLITFSIIAFCVMMLRGGFPQVDFTNVESTRLLVYACLIGFAGSFVAFVFQSIGQKNTNEAEAAILISTESLFGPIFAILFYNVEYDIKIFLAIILVFSGIVLSEVDIPKSVKTRLSRARYKA